MLALVGVLLVVGLIPDTSAHDRPVIGVLVQEISKVFELLYKNQYNSFIPASYVKWIETGGARVVPIWLGKDQEYYENILSKLNGVLLTGGSVVKNKKGGYADAAEKIMEIARKFNKQQDFFPVFGMGLGMDFMLYLSNDKKDISVDCHLEALSVSLILSQKDSKRTAVFNSSSDHIKRLMTNHPIAVLNAKKCFNKETFAQSKLADEWIPLSFNHDQKGATIVTSVEHDYMPFYGTLFHSEKIPFEWAENTNIPHTLATVEASQFFANYFVNEARKSSHTFGSQRETLNKLIENYPPMFTAKDGSNYFQSFLFKRDQEL